MHKRRVALDTEPAPAGIAFKRARVREKNCMVGGKIDKVTLRPIAHICRPGKRCLDKHLLPALRVPDPRQVEALSWECRGSQRVDHHTVPVESSHSTRSRRTISSAPVAGRTGMVHTCSGSHITGHTPPPGPSGWCPQPAGARSGEGWRPFSGRVF